MNRLSQFKWHTINSFPFRFALLTDEVAFKRYAKKRNWDVSLSLFSKDGWTLDYTEPEGPYVLVYVNPEHDDNPDIVFEVLVHEAVHVWQRLVTFIREENPSEEFEAYTIQHIFRTLLNEYAEYVKRKRSVNPVVD